MMNIARAGTLSTALLVLAACGGGGDQVVTPPIPVAPPQNPTSQSFADITNDFNALTATINAEPPITLGALPPTGTGSYAGQYVGTLSLPGTAVTGDVVGTVELTLDFGTPTDSVGSVDNIMSDTITGIDGQVNLGILRYTSVNSAATNPLIISGAYGGTLTVTDPAFASQPSGTANGVLVGGATGANADRVFFTLANSGAPSDYIFEGAIVAD